MTPQNEMFGFWSVLFIWSQNLRWIKYRSSASTHVLLSPWEQHTSIIQLVIQDSIMGGRGWSQSQAAQTTWQGDTLEGKPVYCTTWVI